MIGKARSVELSLMGERLPAEKALEWGLVNRVYDDAVLMEEAMKLAHELANGPTIALSLIRKLYWDSPENSFEEQLNLEFESQRIAGAAEDFKEGVTAFLEKRPAEVQGQMIEDRTRTLRRLLVSGRDRRHWRRKTFRRRQPGDLDVRHRAPERQCRRHPAPRAAGLWRVAGRAAGLDAEATLMQLAHDAGLPSPRVMHVLTPEDELGTGFIMQRVEGETIARKILRDEQFAKARPMLARPARPGRSPASTACRLRSCRNCASMTRDQGDRRPRTRIPQLRLAAAGVRAGAALAARRAIPGRRRR